METWKKNKEALKKLNQNFIMVESEASISISSEQSRDGNYYLVCEVGGQAIKLNSTYRPLAEAKQWAAQYTITKRLSVVYMFGLGNGYFVRELLSKLKPDDRLVIIEPELSVLSHVMEYYDLTDIFTNEKVSLFAGEKDEVRFYSSLENFVHWTNLASQVVAIHPGYEKCFPDSLARYEQMLRNNNEKEIRNRNTEAVLGKIRVENTIRNLRYINGSSTLGELSGMIPKGVPAIIVAAGPSLDKNIEVLKQAKGHSFLIACDTALRHMKKHDIVPDAAITVDARKPAAYFENAGFEHLPVFTTTSANYKALDMGQGRKIWFSGHPFHIAMYQEMGKYLSYRTGGGSVATAAFALASSLGFSVIILIGQDLAYAKEGDATHAGGEQSKIRREAEGICYVPGIDGDMVKTRYDWNVYRTWFVNAIKEFKSNCTSMQQLAGKNEVIDATEGGALIEGTKIMTLSETIDLYCKKQFLFMELIEKLKVDYTLDKKIIPYLKQAANDLMKMEQLLQEGVSLTGDCLNRSQTGEVFDVPKRLGLISKEMAGMKVYPLADEYARNETMAWAERLCDTTEDEGQNRLLYLESSLHIYQELQKAVREVKPLLEETIKGLEETEQ